MALKIFETIGASTSELNDYRPVRLLTWVNEQRLFTFNIQLRRCFPDVLHFEEHWDGRCKTVSVFARRGAGTTANGTCSADDISRADSAIAL